MLLLSLCLTSSVAAFAVPANDLDTRSSHYSVTYTVNPDGSYAELRESANKILTERAVSWMKQDAVTFSTSTQVGEVVYAYTLKADGRRIDVPSNNFQMEINKGKDKGAPVYSDHTTLTVIFPDVAVGDTVVWSYRLTAKEPLFPGQFSAGEFFSKYAAYDDADITLDMPASMPMRYKATDFVQTADDEKNGRRVIAWRWQNSTPEKRDPYDIGIAEPETWPGVFMSTFKSYADIAAAYGSRARPVAAVTPQVQKLADDITAGVHGRREITKSLYEWVARNITYAGNCIGLGAVVPRDLSFVINNRMGDCKDHATLYQALLAAKGIDSIQVLVNAGNVYSLPEIPIVAMVNHVINYLPEFDMYADSTADNIPFGMLPFSDQDKPALWTEHYRDGTRTPKQPIGSNRQVMKTTVRIANDGTANVSVQVALKGRVAVEVRDKFRNRSHNEDDDLVKSLLKGMDLEGDGTFRRDDAGALLDTFNYSVEYKARNMFPVGAPGALSIYPLMFSDMPVNRFLQSMQYDKGDRPVACSNGFSSEEYVFVLPKSMKVVSVPKGAKVEMPAASYVSSYSSKGNVLRVKRVLDDRTPGSVCDAGFRKAYNTFLRKVAPDLKAQVVYN